MHIISWGCICVGMILEVYDILHNASHKNYGTLPVEVFFWVVTLGRGSSQT